MADVILTAAARADLKDIQTYITSVLSNPSAAQETLRAITAQLRRLERFPEMGTPLVAGSFPHQYRYLICKNYLAFYRTQDDTVIVDRILYGRRDYMSLLFEDELIVESDI